MWLSGKVSMAVFFSALSRKFAMKVIKNLKVNRQKRNCAYFLNYAKQKLARPELSIISFDNMNTVRKVSKYGVFSGPYFPVFGLNTEIYGVNYGPKKLRIWTLFTQWKSCIKL